MNIIISSDNLQRSLSINLRGWRTPLTLLIVIVGLFVITYRIAINLAETWARDSDPRVVHMVERHLAQATAARHQLWASTVDRLDQELSDLQVRLWRIGVLGNQIADRLGLTEEIMLDIDEIPPYQKNDVDEELEPSEQISALETRIIETFELAKAETLRLNQIGISTSHVAMQRATVPMRYPIDGKFWSTSRYGVRKDPFTGRRAFHSGYDFAARKGTPVLAAANGMVTYHGRLGNCGKMIELYHGDGVSTLYCHLNDYRTETGNFVIRGQVIGLVGSTGRSSGPHLHYEIRQNDQPNTYKKIITNILDRRPLVALAPPEDLELK